MKIQVIGLGVVGLPLALFLARSGVHEVIGVDKNDAILARVKAGEPPEKLATEHGVTSALKEIPLTLVNSPVKAGVSVICVATPDEGIQAVKTAIKQVLEANNSGLLVLVSTMPPGKTEKEVKPLLEGTDIRLIYAPERVFPGQILQDLEWERTVVGVDADEDFEAWAEIITDAGGLKPYKTTILEAELCKILENTSRDIDLAKANEFLRVAREYHADFGKIRRIINTHPRVNVLAPGIGVGGDCIPTDSGFLLANGGKDLFRLCKAAREVNLGQPAYIVKLVQQILGKDDLSGERILVLGTGYKANTPEQTNSPAEPLAAMLSAKGARVSLFEPLSPCTYNSMPRGRYSLGITTVAHDVFFLKFWEILPEGVELEKVLDCPRILKRAPEGVEVIQL